MESRPGLPQSASMSFCSEFAPRRSGSSGWSTEAAICTHSLKRSKNRLNTLMLSMSSNPLPTGQAGPTHAPELAPERYKVRTARVADVLIVGAGPAGLAVAIASGMRGMRVRVVDVGAPPVDKACGEGLLPDAMASLAALGVRVAGGFGIRGIRFHDAGRVAEGRFTGPGGRGVRRTVLHGAMLERAGALGIEVEWQTSVRGLDSGGERFVVGADGGQSRVRLWAGLDHGNAVVTTRRVGLRQHFAVRPWSDRVEVFWGAEGQAYVTPVGEAEIGVALLSRRKFASMAEGLRGFPELRERLSGMALTSTARGAATVTRRLRCVTAGQRVALVGDASGSVDAITGEGLNLCFRQAEALAGALAVGRLDAYEGEHRATMRMPRVMSGVLLGLGRSPELRAVAMAGLGRWPGVFDALLRMHAGTGTQAVPRWAQAPATGG